MARRWRQIFYKLVPSWLSSGEGEKVLYSLGRVTDGFLERARQSLTARFPTYLGPTGLRMMGDERGIIQGRSENLAGYARRLREWRGPRGHLTRGSPYAMLRQIWSYFGGMKCQELDTGGNVYTIARDGTETATHGGEWNWDVEETPVATAALDASAGSDSCTGSLEASPALLLAPGASGTYTAHCDGTPGRLIFLHVGLGGDGTLHPTTVPDGWTLLVEQTSAGGTGGPYTSRVYWKFVGPYESFTTVTIACTNQQGAGNVRFIARAVNVTGVFPEDPILEVATATGNGTSIATPALSGQDVPALGLLFVLGRRTTYSAASGGWTELGAELVQGATGIGIDEQSITVPTTGQASGTITLGATSAVSMIAVTVKHKTPQDWFRFWLKLVPDADHGITSWGTIAGAYEGSLVPGRGFTIGQKGVTPGDCETIRGLFLGKRPWKMAGTRQEWLCLVLNQDEAHAPDGTWRYYTHEGAPARYAGWRYWNLRP